MRKIGISARKFHGEENLQISVRVSSVGSYPRKRDANHEAKCKAWLMKEYKKKCSVITPKQTNVISENLMNKTVTATDPATPSSSSSKPSQSTVCTTIISTGEPVQVLTTRGNGVFHTSTLLS